MAAYLLVFSFLQFRASNQYVYRWAYLYTITTILGNRPGDIDDSGKDLLSMESYSVS